MNRVEKTASHRQSSLGLPSNRELAVPALFWRVEWVHIKLCVWRCSEWVVCVFSTDAEAGLLCMLGLPLSLGVMLACKLALSLHVLDNARIVRCFYGPLSCSLKRALRRSDHCVSASLFTWLYYYNISRHGSLSVLFLCKLMIVVITITISCQLRIVVPGIKADSLPAFQL